MAEGDTIHRNAGRLGAALAGRPLIAVEAPNPRSQLAAQTDRARALVGRVLERADAHGKHLFLRFEGGLTLHSHQGMNGSWHVYPRGRAWRRPRRQAWAILAADGVDAVEFGGTRVALRTEGELRLDPRLRALGPDILDDGFDPAEGVGVVRARAHGSDTLGELLLNQGVVAGIGNIFKAEGCWGARVDPWRTLDAVSDEELERVLTATRELMQAAVADGRMPKRAYGNRGRPCPRCGGPIASRGQGDANRTTYWCPGCQG